MGCHKEVGEDPVLHTQWVISKLGEGLHDLLTERKNSIKKWYKGEKDEMRKNYQEQYKEIETLRNQGYDDVVELIAWE